MLHGESLNANHESSHLLKNGHRLSDSHEHHQYDSIDDDPPSDSAIPIHRVNDSHLENYSFNDVSPFSDKDKDKDDAIFSWGGTPGLRKLWISYPSSNMVAPSDEINQGTTSIYGFSNASIDHSIADDTLHYIDVDIALHQEYESENWRHSVVSSAAASQYVDNNPPTLSDTTTSNSSHQEGTTPSTRHMSSIDSIHKCITSTLVGAPGVIIAVVLNLFMSMSFGQAFFPSDFNFPSEVPRSIGVQMFLFSTLISQLVMTQVSDFPSAMGMMMVENIPFMHIIAEICVTANGTYCTCREALSL